MIREPTRWSAGFLIAGLTNALLHFVTFVDFGFVGGYATIFRLVIHDGAGIMVGTPLLLSSPPIVLLGPFIQSSRPFNSFS